MKERLEIIQERYNNLNEELLKPEVYNDYKKINVTVENSRMEIDGGYEGVNSLALVEAKNVVAEDFLVRQLYYPYRLWKSKITKKVRPIYVVYSNGIFASFVIRK